MILILDIVIRLAFTIVISVRQAKSSYIFTLVRPSIDYDIFFTPKKSLFRLLNFKFNAMVLLGLIQRTKFF